MYNIYKIGILVHNYCDFAPHVAILVLTYRFFGAIIIIINKGNDCFRLRKPCHKFLNFITFFERVEGGCIWAFHCSNTTWKRMNPHFRCSKKQGRRQSFIRRVQVSRLSASNCVRISLIVRFAGFRLPNISSKRR